MRTHKRTGAVLVMAAVLMVVLLGLTALAIDLSRLYFTRQYLINACDAAVLAGGLELPDADLASVRAGECATANKLASYQISFPEDGLSENGPSKLRVDGQVPVEFGFARILGLSGRTVKGHAVVLRTTNVEWVNGRVIPCGIPFFKEDGTPYQYNTGELYTLKSSTGSTGRVGGNFFPLALDRSLGDGGSGAQVYKDAMKWGFDGLVSVGDIVDTEPGNMIGPTRQAVNSDMDSLVRRSRVAPWADDTWDNFDYGNPRIVITPIVSPLSTGRTEVTILGFAAFWVDSIVNQEVKGYFLNYTIPGSGGTGGPNYGLSAVELVE